MQSRDLQGAVIDLIADQCGIAREKVLLSKRLSQDLGIEGGDAVELFESVQERFGTDLTALGDKWNDHFLPEGFPFWHVFITIPIALIGSLAGFALGLGKFLAFVIGVALVVAVYWAMARWGPPDRMIPITVGQVVAAVEAGKWPSRPSE
jgi:acyl carrier protein